MNRRGQGLVIRDKILLRAAELPPAFQCFRRVLALAVQTAAGIIMKEVPRDLPVAVQELCCPGC